MGKCKRYEERRAVASSRDITSGPEGRSPSFFCARLAALSRCFSTRAISFCRFLKVVRDPTAICAPMDSKDTLLVQEGQRPPLPANLPAAVLSRAAAVPAEPTAARATFLWPGFVNIEHATIEFAAIESRNCALSFSIIAHLYKSKAPGPAGFAVGHEVYAVNSPMRLEHGSNRIFGGPEAEVSDKYILQVFFFFLTSTEQQMDAQNRADFRTMRESRTANCQSISV